MASTKTGVAMLIVIASALTGCQKPEAAAGKDTSDGGAMPDRGVYTVVTTVGMITDIVKEVAGNQVRLQGLIGAGVDPHLFKATRNDIAALQAADVVFYNGLLLEGKMSDVLVRIARDGKPVHAVTEKLDPATLLEPPEFAGHPDPHVWMDVRAWAEATRTVAEALAEYDPKNATRYRANADAYVQKLDTLDAYVRKAIGSIPESRRVLITAHDAFNYFGRAYGIEVMGIQGISTESEAGLDDINGLVDRIVSRQISAVFVETSVAEKNVRALIEGARARGASVQIGGSLFSDAMGAPGTYEGTYIGMIDHNATIIARALGGEAPERGLNGQLGTIKTP